MFHDRPQAAGSGTAFHRKIRDLFNGILFEGEAYAVHFKQFLILLDHCVPWLLEDPHQSFLVKFIKGYHYRHPPYKLRNQSELHQVFRKHLPENFPDIYFTLTCDLCLEPHGSAVKPVLDDLVESFESTAADKQNIRGIDLKKLLMRMLASALRRNRCDGPLQDLQQCLLNTFT